MEIYKLGLDFDMSDVTLPKLKVEKQRNRLKFQSHVKAIFEQLKDFITWGSFGVIVGDPTESKDGDKEQPYVWSTQIIDPAITRQLNLFLKDVKKNPQKYLVLAQLGEELHLLQKGPVVPCLVMTGENVGDNTLDGIRISKWDKIHTESLQELSDSVYLSGLDSRWAQYHNKVKSVTAEHENSICYIPAVCRRNSDQKVLAGGLVLCVKKGNLSDIFKHLPDIQLFLRLLFTELLIADRQIGLTVAVPPFVAFLQNKAEGVNGWFKTNTTSNVKHNFCEMKEPGWKELLKGIKSYTPGIPNNFDTYFALKELSLSGLSPANITPTMLAILALSAVHQQKNKCSLEFEVSSIEGQEPKLPCRKVEKMQLNNFMLSEFYKYVLSAVHVKHTRKKLIESIKVDKQSIKIQFSTVDYSEKLCGAILHMFSEMLEDRKPRHHDASTHLGNIIIWSGYHFCTEKCTEQCQTNKKCTDQPFIALYSTNGKSELCISVGTPEFPSND